jgi:exodeoxyribonuclease VII small subunit
VPDKKPGAAKPGLEICLAELEDLVKKLESGDLPLDQAVEMFEKGVKLGEECRKQIEEAETRVEMLLKKGGKVEPGPMPPAQ